MRTPKVSVIVPVYNVEKYLDRCLQSILNQTLNDIEVILVDDGSPDACPKLCDEYALKDYRINVMHKKNAGLGMACNSGLELANGEYVAFCDSDDWVDTNMYQSLYDTAINNGADVVISGLKRVGNDGKLFGYLPHKKEMEEFTDETIQNLILDMIASPPKAKLDRIIQVSAKVVLYKRSLLEANKLRFVSERVYPSEDLIFNVLVLSHSKNVVVVPECYYNYFVNLQSITTTVKPLHYKNIKKTVKLLSTILSERQKDGVRIDIDELQLRIARFLIGEARSQAKKIVGSSLSDKEKKELLADLRSDVLSEKSVAEYPISQLPVKYYLIHYLLIKRFYSLVSFVLKNK